VAGPKRQGRAARGDRARTREAAAGDDFLEGGGASRWLAGGAFLLTLILFADFVFSNGMLFGSDTIPSGIFFRGLYRDSVREFVAMPMWDRYILGGLPFVDAMHGDTFYPAAILQFFLPLHRALGYKLVLHVFLAGAGMYLFLRAFGLRRVGAAIGGLCYMFAPTFVTFVFAGHDAKMYVIALLPYQFYFLERGFRSRSLRPFLMLGGVTGLSILSSHTQMAYFALWGVGLYFLYRLYFLAREPGGQGAGDEGATPRREAAKAAGFFAVALAAALAVGAVQLVPAYAYVKNHSVRGTAAKTSFEHATEFSLHPEEIASLVVPEFVGYRTQEADTYWGRNPFKLNAEYAGILPLVFGALALALRRDRRVWFFLGGGVLALLYALTYHTPLFRLCYELVPGVQNFRSQGMIAFLYAFCACVLGAIGVDQVLDPAAGASRESRDRISKILKIIGGILLAGGVAGVLLTRFSLDVWIRLFYGDITPQSRQVLDAALPGIRSGAAICLALALAGVALAWARIHGKISTSSLFWGLGLVALVDTWRIDRQFIHVVDPEAVPGFRTDGLIAALQQRQAQEGPFRVLDLTRFHERNELGAHRIETVAGVNGFHDNELRWYRPFRGEGDERLLNGLSTDSGGELKGPENHAFLNLLNVRYILYRPGPEGPVRLFENRDALGRAFVASSYQVLGSAQGVLDRLAAKGTDYRNVVPLEEEPGWGAMPGGEGAAGVVQDIQYRGDEVDLRVRMNRRGVLVLCDNYHPYWKATDNGREARIRKGYTTLRAVCLEAGDHRVRFTYVSRPYHISKWITALSLIAILAAVRQEWLPRRLRRL
jgi:hypothetical protein